MIWFLPHRVNKPWRKTAYANGAFMLMHRTCYEAIGGHERFRTEVNEDIQMARAAKRMGLRLRVVENEDLYRTRMYETPGEAWRGWSRIFYGCFGSVPRLALAMLPLVALCAVPWASLIAALVASALVQNATSTPWTLAAYVWLVVIAFKQLVLWRVYRVLHVAPVWSLTYVLGAVVTLGMLISAMLKTLGASRMTWRGTTYRGDRLEAAGQGQHCQGENRPCRAPAAEGNEHPRPPAKRVTAANRHSGGA
jgi:hypothetical protein